MRSAVESTSLESEPEGSRPIAALDREVSGSLFCPVFQGPLALEHSGAADAASDLRAAWKGASFTVAIDEFARRRL
jgi:hypothetical protein